MNIYWEFPAGWWVIILIIYGLYLLLFFQRKSYQMKDEVKTQVLFAITITVIALIIELVAVNLNVWTYFPGNWPVILWFSYFGSGLLGYQLIKKIEESIK